MVARTGKCRLVNLTTSKAITLSFTIGSRGNRRYTYCGHTVELYNRNGRIAVYMANALVAIADTVEPLL